MLYKNQVLFPKRTNAHIDPVLFLNTVARGQDLQNNNSKNQSFGKKQFFNFIFLCGRKENFVEYFLNLAYAELYFSILINYLVGKY
jgi:hypothetical protein